ncbi:DUF747 family protein [Plectosphaerella plurivora]|uniref:DUF747 family protein n=1 Tax=Plectosphaerella plurivora TaxID=936078 RepID=A0A9P9AB44_9PEZI|nr:DUF747 family protein [Plectosphaerella plurivora]
MPTPPPEPMYRSPPVDESAKLPTQTSSAYARPASPAPTLPTIPSGCSEKDSSSDGQTAEEGSRSPGLNTQPAADDNKADPTPTSRSRAGSASDKRPHGHDHVRRLSAAGMQQLVQAPESLPVAIVAEGEPTEPISPQPISPLPSIAEQLRTIRQDVLRHPELVQPSPIQDTERRSRAADQDRRPATLRTLSTPPDDRKGRPMLTSPRRNSFNPSAKPPPLYLNLNGHAHPSTGNSRTPMTLRPPTTEQPLLSPLPPSIPLPPMSIPTHLQLEMATQRPSPLYIHNSHANDGPYESMAIRIERLFNLLVLPFYLERTLYFGALACLDAWLYNFTILPMRFVAAIGVVIKWWLYVVNREMRWALAYVWGGIGRLWSRGRRASVTSHCAECMGQQHVQADLVPDRSQGARKMRGSVSEPTSPAIHPPGGKLAPFSDLDAKISRKVKNGLPNGHRHSHTPHGPFRHRRTKSLPSNLTSRHKADLLQGAVILFSCLFLMRLDASRMYHVIRGQDAIKLYVIYNVLEVGDRLLSALGQDIFECLLSDEALSRNKFGRSKLLLPFGLFALALLYTTAHSVVLYYQVITLNVAVNSYSNALLTLLLSNQFVEIKSTVFKRFEKDNLFQLTCADIVERFQLWLMLFIIGMRNVVEVGGLSIPGTGYGSDVKVSSTKPLHSPSILPHSFTVLPPWLWSGEVLSPFLIVIGSEILVDTIKHAYINKFNKIRPKFYSRILDILCKDYYTNAFVTPSLTRRVGLAVLPLSCLFIRASVQTYHMFLSTHVPAPILESTQTSLTAESATPSSPVMVAALDRLDTLIRDALGRAVYGYPHNPDKARSFWSYNSDDVIAAGTMLVVFFIAFLVLLIFKLLLGMLLLRYSRNRYAAMKQKEFLVSVGQAQVSSYDAKGKRLGGYGHIELTDDKRRWIHADRDEGLKGKGRPEKGAKAPEGDYQGVQRYDMVTKRIW